MCGRQLYLQIYLLTYYLLPYQDIQYLKNIYKILIIISQNSKKQLHKPITHNYPQKNQKNEHKLRTQTIIPTFPIKQTTDIRSRLITKIHIERHQRQRNIAPYPKLQNLKVQYLSHIHRNAYETSYMNRLQERQQILLNKKRQLDEIMKTHNILQNQINMRKQNQYVHKSTLANQYKSVMEDKKNKQSQLRRREIQEEKIIVEHNRKLFELEQEKKRQEMYESKRVIQEQLVFRETLRLKQKQQRQKEKEQFNNNHKLGKVNQNSKQLAYKQYYSQFSDNSNTNSNNKQSFYNDSKLGYSSSQKNKVVDQFTKRQQEQMTRTQMRIQQQLNLKAQKQKQILKMMLQSQIQDKQRRKSLQMQQKRAYHQQISQQELTRKQHENFQKLRKRQEQRRYDEDLSQQIKAKTSLHLQRDNSVNLQRTYNPITNPIDFKIGINNPYVIREYQVSKERFMGDGAGGGGGDLKLRNLAAIGNKSLASQ